MAASGSESPNGTAYILADRAPALAHYPHMRRAGDFLYVSGISSRRLDNSYAGVTELGDGSFQMDIREQTKAVLENINIILNSAGASLKNVVDVTVFLVNMDDYKAFNEVYNTFFEAETGPARTTVGVRQLPSPKLLIEIKAVALAPK